MDHKYIDNEGIKKIYTKHVAVNYTKKYLLRYIPLPLEKNSKDWKWEGKDFPRVISLLEFDKYIREHNLSFTKTLCINGSQDPEYEYVDCGGKTTIYYEDDPVNHDLHALNLNERDFDFIMLNQTIEHLYSPITCLQNVYKHMKSGGIMYANVPSNNIPHSTPYHYYTGLTPTGLGAITEAAGFKILSIGQWGNLDYLQKLYTLGKWPDYRMLNNPGINDFNNPVTTWIFAQKE